VRFATSFREQRERLTLEGYIVVGPEILDTGLSHSVEPVKVALDQLHLRKIDLADEIFVVNVDGYYGASTSREIAYARRLGKPIRWLVPQSTDALAPDDDGRAP